MSTKQEDGKVENEIKLLMSYHVKETYYQPFRQCDEMENV